MKLKTYMIIEVNCDESAPGRPIIEATPLKVKMRRGMLNKDIKESLDVKDDWTPGQAERPYFFPGCSVPRFKVRERFNITIKPEYATAAFISPETLEGSEDGFDSITRMYPYNVKSIIKWIRTCYGEDHPFTVKVSSLSHNCEDLILMHNDCVEKIRHVGLKIPNSTNPPPLGKPNSRGQRGLDFSGYRVSDNVKMVYPERTNLFMSQADSIFDRLTCDLYDQNCMLKLVNADCLILDDKRYEEMCLMAGANDKDNLSTVMELMANCNFDKSCIYLLCLLQKYGKEMAPMKGASHINFKSLLYYFELDVKILKKNLELDKLISILERLGKLTQSNFQKLSALFPITKEYELHSTHKYVIPGYALKEEYLSQLDDEDIIEDAGEIDIPDDGDVAFINQ